VLGVTGKTICLVNERSIWFLEFQKVMTYVI